MPLLESQAMIDTLMGQKNRVAQAIANMGERVKTLDTEKSASLHKSLNMSFDEFCRFQEYKSLAFANGKLTQDEAQLIYIYLGNNPEHFNNQSLAVKVVLTKAFAELMGI